MASLAQQLKSLAFAEGITGTTEKTRHASLLFSEEEAARMELETVCAIGSNGFQGLASLSRAFEQFDGLFGPSSVEIKRHMQTAEENRRLDDRIELFLLHLSPHLQTQAAQKALEWLIRRFRVHENNVTSLMACCLPYHNTILFARIVQLVNLDKVPSFQFLKHVKQTGAPLERDTLIKRCSHDLALLQFLTDSVEKVLDLNEQQRPSSLAPVLGLFSSVCVGILSSSSKNEGYLRVLLPQLFQCLQCGRLDALSAGLALVVALNSTTSLDTKVVDTLIVAICKHVKQALMAEMMSALAVLIHVQDVAVMPEAATAALLPHFKHVAQVIGRLSASHNIDALILSLSGSLLASAQEGHLAALEQLLSDATLAPKTAKIIAQHVLTLMMSTHKQGAVAPQLARCFSILEVRHTAQVDQVISSMVASMKDSADRQQLGQLLSTSLHAQRHTTVGDDHTPLFLTLNHPEAHVRVLAIEKVNAILAGNRTPADAVDIEFFRQAVADRLHDNDWDVVSRALTALKHLATKDNAHALSDNCLQVLKRAMLEKQTDIASKVVSFCCNDLVGLNAAAISHTLATGLLPYLFSSPHRAKVSRAVLKAVVGSSLSQRVELFSKLGECFNSDRYHAGIKTRSPSGHAAACDVVLSNLASGAPTDEAAWKLMEDLEVGSVAHTLLLVVQMYMMRLSDGGTGTMRTKAMSGLKSLADLTHYHGSNSDLPTLSRLPTEPSETGLVASGAVSSLVDASYVHDAASDRQSLHRLLQGLALLLCETIDLETVDDAGLNSDDCDDTLLAVVDALNFASRAKATVVVLEMVIAGSKASPANLFAFLLACQEPFELSGQAKAACAHAFEAFFQHQLESGGSTTDNDELEDTIISLVPYFIVGLASPIDSVRSATLQTVHHINQQGPSGLTKHAVCKHLFPAIVDRSHDLRVDPAAIGILMSDIATGTKSKSFVKSLMSLCEDIGNASVLAAFLAVIQAIESPQKFLAVEGVLSALFRKEAVSFTPAEHRLCLLLLDCVGLNTAQAAHKDSKIAAALNNVMSEALSATSVSTLCPSQWLCVAAHALKVVLPRCMPEFPEAVQRTVFHRLVPMLAGRATADAETCSLAHTLVVSTPLPADLIAEELSSALSTARASDYEQSSPSPKRRKGKRSSKVSAEQGASDGQHGVESKNLVSQMLMITPIMEAVQAKAYETLLQAADLVLPLFGAVAACNNLPSADDRSEVESLCQACLATLVRVIEGSSADDLNEDHFNTTTAVQTIRLSSNPYTHQQALLLLAAVARVFPHRVMHAVLPIFTFMGQHTVRRDDQMSLMVIDKTIETIVPAITLPENTEADEHVRAVLGIFVDVLENIPAHRRLPLFRKLISTLGAGMHLSVAAALLLKKEVVDSGSLGRDQTEKDLSGLVASQRAAQPSHPTSASAMVQHFVLSLFVQFDLRDQLAALSGMLELFSALAPRVDGDGIGDDGLTPPPHPLFDTKALRMKQLRHFRYLLARQISTHLGFSGFLKCVVAAETKADSDEKQQQVRDHSHALIEQLLTVSASTREQATRGHASLGSGKYWAQLVTDIEAALLRTVALLTIADFCEVTDRLLKAADPSVQAKIAQLLADKVGDMGADEREQSAEHLLAIVPTLDDVIARFETGKKGFRQGQNEALLQNALLARDVLSAYFASTHPDAFTTCLDEMVSLSSKLLAEERLELTTCSLASLGVVCKTTGMKSMPWLPSIMQLQLAALHRGTSRSLSRPNSSDASLDEVTADTALCMGAIASLDSIVQSMGNFLGQALKDLVGALCHHALIKDAMDIRADGDDQGTGNVPYRQQREQLCAKAASVRSAVAASIKPHLVFPAIYQAYAHLSKASDADDRSYQWLSLVNLVELLSKAIDACDRAALKTQGKPLFKFFVGALDVRRALRDMDRTSVAAVESALIDAFVVFVMKLSDAVFRPMFLQLVDWASRTDKAPLRPLTLYRLMERLISRIRRFFVSYYGNVLQPCTAMLEGSASIAGMSRDDRLDSIHYIVQGLRQSFLFDEDGFLSKARFRALVKPLVHQLEQFDEHEDGEEYMGRVSTDVVPCLAEMAVCIGKEALWRELNKEVLNKTRSESKWVRVGALMAVETFYSRLGDEFLGLLPDSILYIAEVLEDDDLDVERQTQKLVSVIEEYLGEPLSKYF